MKKTTDSRILSIIVLVTCPDEESANKIAVSLIEKKLAACVNTTDNVESIFRWKGKIEKSSERLLIIKSKKRLLKKLIADVQQNHEPYHYKYFQSFFHDRYFGKSLLNPRYKQIQSRFL